MIAKTNEDGFTLLEVLVAFSILVVGLAGVYQVFIGGLHNEQIAKQEATALLLAQSKLAAVGLSEPLVAGNGALENGFDWTIDLAPMAKSGTQSDPAVSAAVWVTATVAWEPTEGSRRRSIALSTLKLVSQP